MRSIKRRKLIFCANSRTCLFFVVFCLFGVQLQAGFAQPRHMYSMAERSAMNLPIIAARDLGTFRDYGLNVDVVAISGGTLGMQALLGGSIHVSSIAAMGPINAVLAGGDPVIIGAVLNKNFVKIVGQKEIRKPSDLIGKKIGVTGFGGANEFSVLLALKAWKMPQNAVTIIPTGNEASRIAAVEAGRTDATVLTYSNAIKATARGLTTIADLDELVPEFPQRLIIVTRSFLKKDRDSVKRYLQAISESIYMLKTNTDLERGIPHFAKLLRVDLKAAEEIYDNYHAAFSFPPRVGQQGMRAVLDIMPQQTGRPRADLELSRFIDESVTDELENEGFFKKLESKNPRK